MYCLWQSCSLVSKGTSEQPCCLYWPSFGLGGVSGVMYSWSQKSLFSVLCPSLAVRKAVTAPSPQQSYEHTRSCYCCACTDLIPSRVSANFCCFCTQNIQCTQRIALRADTIKKALLPLPILASTVAILFYGHWGQTSLFPGHLQSNLLCISPEEISPFPNKGAMKQFGI